MYYRSVLYAILLLIISSNNYAQEVETDTLKFKTIVAEKFKESNFHQWLWGRNHRQEWATAVRVPVLWLDTAYGGLKPYETGGGNESKTFHLRTSNGKEYSLHSIRKTRDDVLLPEYRNTFIEDIVKDGISLSHPYGAFALPVMLEHAGIYHPIPTLVYLPYQDALDTFNKKYGNDLYLLEQKPKGDWSEADNLGNFKDYIKSDKLIEKLQEDNKNKADQHAFIKARLFDMLIGDWDRHKENWVWGERDTGKEMIYEPIPRDRDQAFFAHNGVLTDRIIRGAGLGFMQNFDYHYGDIKTFNFESRDFDRFFSNEMTLDDWQNAAKSLQKSLPDAVIAESIHHLPPEVFAVCGNELIEKLKARRNQLIQVAKEYYFFLAKEIEIVGSKEREYFEVTRKNSGEAIVAVFRIDKDGRKERTAYYKRIFKPNETKEIRIYGIAGKDIYEIDGNSTAITVRIIGGGDKDTITQTGSKIQMYDDRDNVFKTTSAQFHFSSDSSIYAYKYISYKYDKKGFAPVIFYSHDDHLYAGLNYHFKKYKWPRDTFSTQQKIEVNYSLSQKAFSAAYNAVYPKAIAGWDLSLNANYDAVRWTNFFGFGNETVKENKSINYYRMRSEEWLVSAALFRGLGKNTISLSTYFQRSKVINDAGRFSTDFFHQINPKVFTANNYTGLQFTYTYLSLNDSIVPTKGFTFIANGSLTKNLTQKDFFQNYDARVQAYIPLIKKISLAIRLGGATAANNSDILNNSHIHQYAVIGGPATLRGYKVERFWGKTAFYNNNELRFITDLRSYLMNGKIGVLAFFDDGRVWIPQENSSQLHTAYGAGILLSPFNYLCLTATYGISKETKIFQVRVNKLF